MHRHEYYRAVGRLRVVGGRLGVEGGQGMEASRAVGFSRICPRASLIPTEPATHRTIYLARQ